MKKAANLTGYFTAFLIMTDVIFKINHLAGADIILGISGIFLSVYFATYIMNRLADTNAGKPMSTHYLLAFSVFLIQLGITFKIQYWKGAYMLVFVGFLVLLLFYFPILLANKIKQKPPQNLKIIYISGFAGITILLTGLILIILAWSLGMPLMCIGAGILFLIYFPLYMYNHSQNTAETYLYLRDVFFAIIIGGILSIFVVTGILNMKVMPLGNACISAEKMNVLYVGIENPVVASASGYRNDELMLSVSNGTVLGSKGEFKVLTPNSGVVTLVLFTKDKIITSKEFRVKRIPGITTYMGGYSGEVTASKNDLLLIDSIRADVPDFSFDASIEVLSFTMSAITIGGKTIPAAKTKFVSNSKAITPEMKEMIKELPVGSKICITDVIVREPNGMSGKDASGIKITIQ